MVLVVNLFGAESLRMNSTKGNDLFVANYVYCSLGYAKMWNILKSTFSASSLGCGAVFKP